MGMMDDLEEFDFEDMDADQGGHPEVITGPS